MIPGVTLGAHPLRLACRRRPLERAQGLSGSMKYVTVARVSIQSWMRISHDILQMSALALSSTIFALTGYALLESLKIHLYGRLARSIEAGTRGLV